MLQRYLAHASASGRHAHEHHVVSLTAPGPVGAAIEAAGVPVLGLDQRPGRPSALVPARLRRLVRELRPDIVHAWMYHANLTASLSCWGLGVPVIWGVHHSLEDPARETRATRAVLRASVPLSRRVDAIVYCSSVSRAQHERHGFAAGRALVVPNGTDTAVFRPDDRVAREARARLLDLVGLHGSPVVIGHFARAHPMKNQGALVRATADLVARGHDVHTVIVGENQTRAEAAAEVERLGLDGAVTLLETRDDVAALVPGLDVYALPSAWGEAFPLAVGEAMAAGVACVATNVGDSAWLVGKTGRIVPPGDEAALTAALEEMVLMGRDARSRLGARARERVEENFSLERHVAAHDRLFEAVAGGAASGSVGAAVR